MKQLHKYVWINIACLLIVLFGAINWAAYGFFNRNMIDHLPFEWLKKAAYFSLAFSGINLLNRDLFLPFLGNCAFPCGLLQPLEPNDANTEVSVKVPEEGDFVIYWASEASEEVFDTPMSAYQSYENSGVAPIASDGTAVLKIQYPAAYNVGSGKTVYPHIHYRICQGGMLSRVYTHYFSS